MDDRKNGKHLTIIGGGAGGLAVGYFARKKNIPFTIHEAAEQAGGNCITIRYRDFSFDSGAHRFHDKIPDITAEVMDFMGDDLMKVDIPSQIYYKRKLIDFPLSPLNLLKNLGLFTFIKAAWEVINTRILKKKSICCFPEINRRLRK
jgi:protoporphyrinogen oxidase